MKFSMTVFNILLQKGLIVKEYGKYYYGDLEVEIIGDSEFLKNI